MKKILTGLSVAVLTISLVGCAAGTGGTTLLRKAAAAESLSYEVASTEEYKEYLSSVERFSQKLAPELVRGTGNSENVAISPISVYMALSLAAECAAGDTRAEIAEALGTTYEAISTQTVNLYEGLSSERKDSRGMLSSKLALGNSIWMQEGVTFKEECLDSLSQKYFCHSYSADFAGKNREANEAIRKFVKEQTNGLIDQDFQLKNSICCTLINTLYLKDVWNSVGEDLDSTTEAHDFTNASGSKTKRKLLQGPYAAGRVFETETFSHFFARTSHGYELKFLVPKEGHAAEEIFTEENLKKVAEADYRETDEEKNIKYLTRCLFPEFEGSYNDDIKETLQQMGIEKLFMERSCDFSTLSDAEMYCSEVKHVTKLKVDKTGVEGAAVTIVVMDTESAPDSAKEVYEDFIVDRAFGFVLTAPNGTTLFSGIVNNI